MKQRLTFQNTFSFARNDGREVKNDPKAAKGKNPKKKHSKCKGLKGAKRAACLKAKKGKHGKKAPKSQNKREPEDVPETRSFGEDLDLEAREPEECVGFIYPTWEEFLFAMKQ